MTFDWHYPLSNMGDSATLAWPVQWNSVPNCPGFRYITFDLMAKEVAALPITTWKDVRCQKFHWRSVWWQWKHVRKALGCWSHATRAIIEKREMSLAEGIAQEGFQGLDIVDLQFIAGDLGIDVSDCVLKMDYLEVLTMNIMKCSEEQALVYIAAGLEGKHHNYEATDVLLGVDEAVQCLAREDLKQYGEAKERALRDQKDVKSFQQEFRAKAKAVKGAKAPAKKAKKDVLKVPAKLDGLEQKDLKLFLPPDSWLWKCRRDGCWRVRVNGWPRTFIRSVSKYGHTWALKLLLTEAWHAHSVLSGREFDELPIEGLAPLVDLYVEGE